MSGLVDKRFGLRLIKPKAAKPIIRGGVTRAGKVGMEFEHEGVKGWGTSESAAHAAWQQNRAARNGVSVGKRVTDSDVAKGFVTQSVKPMLARTTAAAGRMIARPTGKAIAKADVSKLGLMEAGKLIPKVAGAGWKAGRTGAKPKMGLRAATAVTGSSRTSQGLRAVGTGAKMAGENPVATALGTGIVGGSVLGAGYAHRSVEKSAVNIVGRCETCGAKVARIMDHSKGKAALSHHMDANANYDHTPKLKRQDYTGSIFPVGKAYGDPEDARYFRLGAGSAVLAGGGLAGVAAGGRRIVRDTKNERNRFKDIPGIDMPTKPHFDPATHKPGGPQEARLRAWQQMERAKQTVAGAKDAKRLKGAAVIHGRAAGLLGGGVAALGGAEMLRRRASERRYN